jgi:hypothetical protein
VLYPVQRTLAKGTSFGETGNVGGNSNDGALSFNRESADGVLGVPKSVSQSVGVSTNAGGSFNGGINLDHNEGSPLFPSEIGSMGPKRVTPVGPAGELFGVYDTVAGGRISDYPIPSPLLRDAERINGLMRASLDEYEAIAAQAAEQRKRAAALDPGGLWGPHIAPEVRTLNGVNVAALLAGTDRQLPGGQNGSAATKAIDSGKSANGNDNGRASALPADRMVEHRNTYAARPVELPRAYQVAAALNKEYAAAGYRTGGLFTSVARGVVGYPENHTWVTFGRSYYEKECAQGRVPVHEETGKTMTFEQWRDWAGVQKPFGDKIF